MTLTKRHPTLAAPGILGTLPEFFEARGARAAPVKCQVLLLSFSRNVGKRPVYGLFCPARGKGRTGETQSPGRAGAGALIGNVTLPSRG
jgi:hypothetical protein